MAEASLCNGVVASPCGGDVGVAGRARAESLSLPNKTSFPKSSSFPDGRMVIGDKRARRPLHRSPEAAPGQMNLMVCKSMRWWEKGVQPNMREIESARDLVDSLRTAGDRLVVVDFFSPGCGGCRALHPKISQFAERNPDVLFLQVNYEKHKSMCYSLHVHVLPFFRFYRGAQGRVSSFSCTNATIKKFKDALAKHGTDRCGLGPARGLDESELLALAANRDLDFTYEPETAGLVVPPTIAQAIAMEAAVPGAGPWFPLPASVGTETEAESSLLSSAGR